MQYKIVTADSATQLGIWITGWLKDGWELVGGVSVGVDDRNYFYAQAIYKEDEEE